MKKENAIILAVAIIWGAVILASAVVLKECGCWDQMLPILGGGAGGSIVVVGGGLRKKRE